MIAVTDRQVQTAPSAAAWRRQAVERAEAYFRLSHEARVPLVRVCRIVGLSERGLRNAFYEVRGMSPKRCMLRERLINTHHALCEARGKQRTVTNVATENGFFELGRFAASYRQAFGEAPSETLRGPRPRPAGRRPSTKGGY